MAELPAKQAQYVAYAEKDSKARNIAAKIDELESKAVTTETIRFTDEEALTILQAINAGTNVQLIFTHIPTADKVIYELRYENPDVSMDLIMYKTGITNGEVEMPCYIGKSYAINWLYSFLGFVIEDSSTLKYRVLGYVDMPVTANSSDVPTATLTNIDVGGVLYSVGGGLSVYHPTLTTAEKNALYTLFNDGTPGASLTIDLGEYYSADILVLDFTSADTTVNGTLTLLASLDSSVSASHTKSFFSYRTLNNKTVIFSSGVSGASQISVSCLNTNTKYDVYRHRINWNGINGCVVWECDLTYSSKLTDSSATVHGQLMSIMEASSMSTMINASGYYIDGNSEKFTVIGLYESPQGTYGTRMIVAIGETSGKVEVALDTALSSRTTTETVYKYSAFNG